MKRILFGLLLILFVGVSFGDQIIDNEVSSAYTNFNANGGNTFSTGIAFNLTGIKIELRANSIGDCQTININLVNTSGGTPTGSILSSGSVDASSLNLNGTYLIPLDYELSGSIEYAFYIENVGGDTTDCKFGNNTPSTYDSGTYIIDVGGGSWFPLTDYDMYFGIYGYTGDAPTPPTPTPSAPDNNLFFANNF